MKQVLPRLMSPLKPMKDFSEILSNFRREGDVDRLPGDESESMMDGDDLSLKTRLKSPKEGSQ